MGARDHRPPIAFLLASHASPIIAYCLFRSSKPSIMKTRPLRLLPQQRQRKYNDDTAVEYTITHALSTGILGMSNTIAHNDISCVMSL